MHKQQFLVGYRVFFGLLTLIAVATQFYLGAQRDTFNPVNFLSFFTIQSNILAAMLLLIAAAMMRRRHQSPVLAIVRGAATLYMMTTGIVYVLLLSGLEESLQTPTPWINMVVHYIMPIAVMLDWLVDLPPRRMVFRRALVWLAFPLAYVGYALVRGHYTQWYPYPFLNAEVNGYVSVLSTSVILAAAMTVLVWVIVWTTQFGAPVAARKK